MARVPLWKLRRLAPRAKRIIERRKGDAPVIAAYEHTVTPAADSYMAAYDRATQMRGSWKLEAQERQEAVAALGVALQCWAPLVIRDVKSFDSSAFLQTSVPDDVIHDAEYIVALVLEHATRTGAPLPYQEPLIVAMNDSLIAARKEHTEAEAADKDYQQCLADVRDKAQAAPHRADHLPPHPGRAARPQRQGLPEAAPGARLQPGRGRRPGRAHAP